MSEKNLAVAEEYYAAMKEKDVEKLEEMLHQDVICISPLDEVQGKDHVFQALKGFIEAFESLNIREVFHQGNKSMLALDTVFPAPFGNLRTASLITAENGKIKKIELFYDGRIIESMKDAIFAK